MRNSLVPGPAMNVIPLGLKLSGKRKDKEPINKKVKSIDLQFAFPFMYPGCPDNFSLCVSIFLIDMKGGSLAIRLGEVVGYFVLQESWRTPRH